MTSKRQKDDGGWFSFKYSHELKHLLPWRPNPKDKSLLPSNTAGLFSYFSLSWLTSLMFKAFRHGLNPSDLWTIQYEDSAAVNTQRLEHTWEEKKAAAIERGETNPKLWKTVFRSIRTRVLVVIALFVLHSHLQVGSQVLVLKLVLNYINTPGTDDVYAGYIVLVYGLIGLCQIAVFSSANVINTHTVAKVTGGVQGLIYNKVLKLMTGGEKLTAQVVNVCNNDMERISEAVHSIGFTISGPILLLTTICYGLYLLGPWILIGQATIIFMCFLVGIVAKAQSKVRFETVKVTDKRVTLMTEIINSIKLIKMFAWEHSFTNNINDVPLTTSSFTCSDLRTVEIKRQCSAAFLQAVNETLTQNINLLAVILTLIGYTLTSNTLHPSSAFIIASLFDSMQFTLGVLPWTVRAIVEAKVSLNRIEKLLEMPEHQARMDGYLNNSTLALEIKNASFAWENVNTDFTEEKTNAEKKQLVVDGKNKANKKNIHHNYSHLSSINLESPVVEGSPNQPIHFIDTLFNIDLRVTSGKLVGVCGNIGSGKSSLLSAIAGDMKKLEGRVLINGDLSLVPQRAWIYNSTLRENILVGGRLDPLRYNDVIWACSLQDDFDLMHNGDMTEVGDRGVNLSGGQKQRVNVARAVYGDGDVFLLDDPLSALDTKVARHIFTNCIKGLLAQKTIILVTHTVHLLKQCDEIIVMESGRITETGTHRELMTRKGEYYSIVNRDEEDTDKEETGKDEEEERGGRRRRRRKRRGEDERELALSGEGRLTTEEKRRSGGVSWKVYRTIVQMCGGWGTASLILLSIVLFTVAKIFTSVWMKVWLDQGDGKMEERQRNKTHHNASMTEEELNGDISKNPDLWMYQMVYGLCYLCVFITGIVKSFSLPFWMLRGAGRLHSAMFDSIIRAPMRFFDTNPPGRIVNRFSRDLDDLDVRVPYFMGLLLTGLILTAGQFILVSCIYVWFIIPLAIIIALFIFTDLFMNAGVRELKRLDNILRSPVTQHIVSTITEPLLSGPAFLVDVEDELAVTDNEDITDKYWPPAGTPYSAFWLNILALLHCSLKLMCPNLPPKHQPPPSDPWTRLMIQSHHPACYNWKPSPLSLKGSVTNFSKSHHDAHLRITPLRHQRHQLNVIQNTFVGCHGPGKDAPPLTVCISYVHHVKNDLVSNIHSFIPHQHLRCSTVDDMTYQHVKITMGDEMLKLCNVCSTPGRINLPALLTTTHSVIYMGNFNAQHPDIGDVSPSLNRSGLPLLEYIRHH
ncbi:hypothetical protein Pcinc_021157 [Petrolisthes cinctipes]|uniref:Uncharacterized protein n=1 Tax=Petrolisthes cinctipes TaxID=88211 RepID=A0AAE1FI06_PETCI|nr:hypothetical protein Pcinc_021157 [Petrolisthes cinctipes]